MIYLGLGSNVGDRLGFLEATLQRLSERPLRLLRVSPVYETPALLPKKASEEWNHSFLNLAVEIEYNGTPQNLLAYLKQIESSFGRNLSPRWAPRSIDIDILCWNNLILKTPELTIPHPELLNRAFVLDPLKDLVPDLIVDGKTLLERSRQHAQHSPQLMGILNITPDSFSDGGQFQTRDSIAEYLNTIESSVGILDIGAESTRPKATPLIWQEEWARLAPILEYLSHRYHKKRIRPQLSVDTYHYEVAERALEMGCHYINDVSGLNDIRMLDLLQSGDVRYILMHSKGLPANPSITLPTSHEVMPQLTSWFEEKLNLMTRKNIPHKNIVIDPGIGFGKTSFQSFEILQNIEELQRLNVPLLIGHSRKSFLKTLTTAPAIQRDIESAAISANLALRGVEILRVHNPVFHKRILSTQQHVQRRVHEHRTEH